MNRRELLQTGIAATLGMPLFAALQTDRLDAAANVLQAAVERKQVAAAVLHVEQGEARFTKAFGSAKSGDAMFLLGSISKPICMTAVMTLFDQGEFQLDDPVKKYLPKFTGDGRETATIRQLLSHASGLPDQLPENNDLRRRHASLADFAESVFRTPLSFAPGKKYQYSSMGILLTARIAETITGKSILQLVEERVFQPLGMKHSAQGVGTFPQADLLPMQIEFAAPEAGAGDPTAKDWDWNSPYWRKLGAPWGGTHASGPDLGRWLREFLDQNGKAVKPETAKLMLTNHNPPGETPRGLGFGIGKGAGSPGCSDQTFGHTGSTGTIAWADPKTGTICVVLTTLPARAVKPHPRDLTAEQVAQAAG